MGGIYLGNALLTHSKVENIIQDNDFYIKADGNNINWVDKEVCTLNISEPTNFTLNDIMVAKQEYRDIILQIDNLDTNEVKITNYLVLESFNSNTLINQFSNDNFIATINSNATITLQKNIKAAPIEDYIVATDEGELTTELPETFGGRTADEYALKSDLENVGSGGGVTSWNDLEDKPFDIETESTQVFRGNIEMALFMTDPTYVTSGKVSLEAGFITPDYYFMEIPDRVIITVGDVKTIVTVNEGGFEYEDKYVRVHKEQTGPGGNWTVLSFMCADTDDFVMEDVTVEIITYENITTIDPMYLPDDLGDKAFYEIRLVGQDYNTYRVYVNSSGQLVAEQV